MTNKKTKRIDKWIINIVFNNGCHESVGGQPTVGHDIDFQLIAKGCGYKSVLQAKTINEIKSDTPSAENAARILSENFVS